MPIIVTPTVTPTPPATGQVTPPAYPAAYWTWTSPTGVTRSLSTEHPYLRPGGITGHMSVPLIHIASQPPTVDGGLYRGHSIEPREVTLGLLAHTRDSDTWRATYRQLVDHFDTTTGDGTLTVHHPDGETRNLLCRYLTGLESPVDGEPGVVKIGTFAVTVRAYDPWWYGPVVSYPWRFPTPQDFIPAGGAPPFYIAPVRVGGEPVGVQNVGDVAAYPVWTFTGPLSEVTVEAESGESFTVTASLAVGESVVVDTDPRVPAPQKITRGGVNAWGIVTDDYPTLWALPAGLSTVTVTATGGTDATRVEMQFNPRYRTA